MNRVDDLIAFAWRNRPSDLTLSVVAIPVGLTAMIVGADVSRALTEITAPVVSRCMGAAFFFGGLFTIYGYLKESTTVQAIGLALLALATGVYGVGVAIGLGLHGIVSASLALSISISKLRRLQVLIELVDDHPAPPLGPG